jgi:hypothetical protein
MFWRKERERERERIQSGDCRRVTVYRRWVILTFTYGPPTHSFIHSPGFLSFFLSFFILFASLPEQQSCVSNYFSNFQFASRKARTAGECRQRHGLASCDVMIMIHHSMAWEGGGGGGGESGGPGAGGFSSDALLWVLFSISDFPCLLIQLPDSDKKWVNEEILAPSKNMVLQILSG